MKKGFNEYQIVIMDGSDKKKVNNITAIINCITGKRHGKCITRSIDSDRPTMIVVEFVCTDMTFAVISDTIEQSYPGLCIFSPLKC